MKKITFIGIFLILISIDSFAAQFVSFSEALKIHDTPEGLNVGRTVDWMIQAFLTIISMMMAIGTALKFKDGDYEHAFLKIIGIVVVALSYSVAKVMAH